MNRTPEELNLMRQLVYFRKLRGRTQSYIAAGLGITTQAYQKYENGDNAVAIRTVYKLSEILGISIFDLLSDKMNEPQKIDQLFFALWNKQDDHHKSLLLALINSMEAENKSNV